MCGLGGESGRMLQYIDFKLTFLEDSIRLKLLVQQTADMENLRTLQRRMKKQRLSLPYPRFLKKTISYPDRIRVSRLINQLKNLASHDFDHSHALRRQRNPEPQHAKSAPPHFPWKPHLWFFIKIKIKIKPAGSSAVQRMITGHALVATLHMKKFTSGFLCPQPSVFFFFFKLKSTMRR